MNSDWNDGFYSQSQGFARNSSYFEIIRERIYTKKRYMNPSHV